MKTRTRIRSIVLSLLATTAIAAGAHADGLRPTLVTVDSPFKGADDFTLLTNECIAKATSGAAREAVAACDGAVKQAEIDAQQARTSGLAVYLTPNAHATLALALSNRAVVHWLNGSADAKADIARAASLAPQAAWVKTNVVALAQPRVATVAAR